MDKFDIFVTSLPEKSYIVRDIDKRTRNSLILVRSFDELKKVLRDTNKESIRNIYFNCDLFDEHIKTISSDKYIEHHRRYKNKTGLDCLRLLYLIKYPTIEMNLIIIPDNYNALPIMQDYVRRINMRMANMAEVKKNPFIPKEVKFEAEIPEKPNKNFDEEVAKMAEEIFKDDEE